MVDLLEIIEEISICFEMTSNESRVDFNSISFRAEYYPIVKLIFTERVFEYLLAVCSLDFAIELENIDVVQIVKILSIKPSEGDHTTSNESS